MNLVYTIIPIFAVILLGWFVKKKGYLPPEFIAPANGLVYHLAIPAMIFQAVSKSSLKSNLHIDVLGIVLASVVAAVFFAWAASAVCRASGGRKGTFVQGAFHGNLGYIGLAVAFYALGKEGFVQAGILAGFIMILQNFLAVTVLQIYCDSVLDRGGLGKMLRRVLGNPVVLSAFAGILFSVLELPIPKVLDRSLDIVGNMALPLALLIIGASLAFRRLWHNVAFVVPIAVVKLLLMPGFGFVLMTVLGIPVDRFVPGLVLLASPSATLIYILAREMNGDTDLAVAIISGTTLISPLTFALWLGVAT